MLEYTRGATHTIYTNFLTLDNQEAINIVDPKVTIRHVDTGNVLIVDVNEADLTLAIETLFFFKWAIDSAADLGFYTIEYQATVDGDFAESNETVKVVAPVGSQPGMFLDGVLYTTKTKVASYLGVDISNIEDDWIEWASRYIDFYTCQVFSSVTVIELYDIDDNQESTLMLDNYPILELLEIKNDGIVMDLDDIAVYNAEGFLKIKENFITRASTILETGFFTRGRQTIEVNYKHGFDFVPKQIEWVTTVLAATIGIKSLAQSGIITAGEVIEEEIGEYRRRKSTEETTSESFSTNIEGAKIINDRVEEDIFSAKTILRMFRDRKMRAV